MIAHARDVSNCGTCDGPDLASIVASSAVAVRRGDDLAIAVQLRIRAGKVERLVSEKCEICVVSRWANDLDGARWDILSCCLCRKSGDIVGAEELEQKSRI